MKKLTLFMLAACASFTTATSAFADETTTTTEPTVATEPTAAASLTSGYYVIKAHVKSTDGYIYHVTSDNNGRPFHVKPLADMGEVLTTLNSNTTYVWYVNALGDGTFTLQNLNSGDYIPAQNSNNLNMATGVAPHTFANAAILKPQSYTSSSDTYTILDGGCLLACTNYTEIDRQIHCNTVSEHNLSYWDQGISKVDGTGSITEFSFYKLTGNFSSDVDESNIQKSTILPVTETQDTIVRKWIGVIGSTYTPHATTTIITKNYGIAYSGVWSKLRTPVVTSTTDLTVSAENCAFTIGSETTVTYSSANVVANPEVFGKYYRILASAGTGNCYITSEDATAANDGTFTTGTINRSSASGNYQSQIWQLEQGENGTVHFKNVNTGAYMNGAWGSVQANATTKGSYTIFGGTGTFNGVDHSKDFELDDENYEMLNAYSGLSAKGLGSWSYTNDQGSYWRFEEVTTVPVTISEANYATVGYPFAVSVPSESGIKAYAAVKAEGGYLTLSEIEDGIIPANTGAILYHDGATTADLTITTTDKTIEGNLLTATTAKRTGYTSGDTYVLALNSSNEAAFLKSELETVPANKAYVATSALPTTDAAANVLNFNFGGDVTGINTVNVANSKANTFYDLNGRRVLYPAHGIFVNGNGQKVLVK